METIIKSIISRLEQISIKLANTNLITQAIRNEKWQYRKHILVILTNNILTRRIIIKYTIE